VAAATQFTQAMLATRNILFQAKNLLNKLIFKKIFSIKVMHEAPSSSSLLKKGDR
jgi:hypothetical protein